MFQRVVTRDVLRNSEGFCHPLEVRVVGAGLGHVLDQALVLVLDPGPGPVHDPFQVADLVQALGPGLGLALGRTQDPGQGLAQVPGRGHAQAHVLVLGPGPGHALGLVHVHRLGLDLGHQ